MSKKMIIVVVLALLVLAGVGGGIWMMIAPKQQDNIASQTTTPTNVKQSEIALRYAAMTGETYDRNYIANMIAHHEGAIDMAKLAQQNAKHEELRSMANSIIAAQQKEVNDMLAWQKLWGYPPSSNDNMMDHSAMGMMDDMHAMTVQLQGKTGDQFDTLFLSLMIDHHQSAIDMSRPGEKNAMHQELKDLTKAIIAEQTAEISQMRSWQNDWGYAL